MKTRSHIIHFNQGDCVFSVGDKADCAYIIESGEIGLYAHSLEDHKIATLVEGELLGEMGVIDDTTRSVSAFAETDLRLMIIDRDQISKRLQKSDPIIRSILEVLLRRIRNMLGLNANQNSKKVAHENMIVAEGLHKIRFEKELYQALENGDIINVYQPMVDLKQGHIAGFEALSRWKHPEKGMISPFEFIALAEESDLILSMGLRSFDKACQQLSLFQKNRTKKNQSLPSLFMSINVSAAQLTAENFLFNIFNLTQKHNINPNHIKLEITESLVVDYGKVKTWIGDCNEMGFKLSLDDFGTGYSGFQHLLELDFHTIKIDQAFTLSIESNPKSILMLEVITDMARKMKMSIVAEGIENLDCAEQLTKIGVDYGQGYYFFKPMMPGQIMTHL